MTVLSGKRIVLGVTGSIAAYKAIQLASDLYKAGAHVDVVLTNSALNFVTPLSFKAITHRIVAWDLFDPAAASGVPHVELADAADCLLVAPISANSIAKLALGLSDDLLGCIALSCRAPLVVAPAMESRMFRHPATQQHLATLRTRGATIIEPGVGHLASGASGEGRLADPAEIIGKLSGLLGQVGDLAGRNIVITAGGTQEPIDPVRYITNRSSGRQGYALAEAARDRGAKVTLISSASLPPPTGISVIPAASAVEMLGRVREATLNADALIMAAAVADFRVANPSDQKIKKGDGSLTVELVKNPDILAEVRGPFVRVGFAAESQDLLQNAEKKLRGKDLDLIVANDITGQDSGFAVETNRVILLDAEAGKEELPLMSKREVADRILDRVAGLLVKRDAHQKTALAR